MKRKKKFVLWYLIAAMLISVFSPLLEAERYQAAEPMYENAYEFFVHTNDGSGKHIKTVDGMIYFGTHAKLAHTYAAGYKYYNTVGYDVTMSAGGRSLIFSVKRGGSLEEVPGSVRVDSNGYEYLLYRIPTQTIIELARLADPVNAAVVLACPEIKVQMDAIITVRQNGVQGSIVEDGKGGIIEYEQNGPIFHLKNQWELEEAMGIFNGTKFNTYTEITDTLYNYQLNILYNVGGAEVGNTDYDKGTYGNTANMLFQDGSIYQSENYKLLQEFKLMDSGPNGLNLNYIGYHLDDGAEWRKSDGTPLSISKTYMPKVLEPSVGSGSKTVVLYANWKPNTYQIIYNANKGIGSMNPSAMTYDVEVHLRGNGFSRMGYTFKGWSTNPNAPTPDYTNQQSVKNLTSANGGEVTLYAIWEPCVYQITVSKQYGNEGTEGFYEKYGTEFYSDENCTNPISAITPPWRIGYYFDGYYSLGGFKLIVDAEGNIQVENTFFQTDTMIYEKWRSKDYVVTFDKQGGFPGEAYGTERAVVYYDALFPINATAPQKDGFSFMGYYTEKDGQGTQIYNEFMATETVYTYDENITLYAYWTDDIPPSLSFTADYSTWTKNKITLTAKASDYGSGLLSVKIYKINQDGTEREVADISGTGDTELTTSYINDTEGITRYRAVTVDVEGHSVEAYAATYYDVTAPTGTIEEAEDEFGKLKLEIDITDINTGG